MRKTKILFVMMLALVLSNAVVSCKKDPAPQETKTVDNPELATKLKALGFAVEGSVITIDNKVQNTTSLDLSAAELTSVEGLEVFPKLEEVNLSDNHFTNTFDFAGLPKTVKRVNLAGNELFQFEGLATVTDNGFTLQRELTELTLPASARFNVDLLPFYYNETKGKVTLKMQNPTNNQIEPYTTLRNIPDENLRNYIKQKFPSIMKGEQVDLLANFNVTESNVDIEFYPPSGETNIEGIQYIINNNNWKGTSATIVPDTGILTAPYLKLNKTIQFFSISPANTPYLDISSAQELRYIWLDHNPSIEVIDLTHSKRFMKSGDAINIEDFSRHGLVFYDCPNLKEIKIAEDIKPTTVYDVVLANLPKLKKFDMSKIIGIDKICLGNLTNTKLILPKELTYNIKENKQFVVSITKNMLDNVEIKDFIIKYGKKNLILESKWRTLEDGYYVDVIPYDYRNLIQ